MSVILAPSVSVISMLFAFGESCGKKAFQGTFGLANTILCVTKDEMHTPALLLIAATAAAGLALLAAVIGRATGLADFMWVVIALLAASFWLAVFGGVAWHLHLSKSSL